MNDALDALDEELSEGAGSPSSGVESAIAAGKGLQGLSHRRAMVELPVYLLVQVAWFVAFGMQTVLFPYLLKNILDVSGTLLGLAQMSLAAPSVVFILLGGVVAERGDGRTLLLIFHLLAALPAAALSFALEGGALAYWMMLIYAVSMGTIGAFMLPARDAILNEVVERRQKAGSGITLQQGVAFATLAQFAAQIVGLAIGGLASHVGVWPLLLIQTVIVAAGAGAAVFLARGRMVRTGRTGVGAVFGDIAEGMRAVRADPVLWSMVASMFGVGVFVIGAFLVVLPIINADVYGQNSSGLRNIFVTFWAGAFCSSAALSRVKRLMRPGRLLLIAQALGSACILVLVTETPYPLFIGLVFIWGLAAGVSIMMSRAIVQAAAPPAMLARVLSIYQLGFMGGAPIGAAMLGVFADHAGPRLVILVPAVGMLALIVWMAFLTPIWRMSPDVEATAQRAAS
ncbi:MFS transporter [bacterium]|nr:MFS transporter [bacterium]